MAEMKGFVYATTGADYTALARRSARSLRAAFPAAKIDLFTDQAIEDPVFDRIVAVNESWFRPKMEALLRSRFDVTVLLDADTIPLPGIQELLNSVNDVDLAGCYAVGRPPEVLASQAHIPRTFPYLNAGVLVLRRNRRTKRLLREWERLMKQDQLVKDQGAFRELLFRGYVRFQVLPPEYNVFHMGFLNEWKPYFGAPRLLHVRALHAADPGDPEQPFDLVEVLGEGRAAKVQSLMQAERNSRKVWHKGQVVPVPRPVGLMGWLQRRLSRLFRTSVFK